MYYRVIEFINHENSQFRIWRRLYVSRENALRDINRTSDVKRTLILPLGHTLLRRN